MGRVAAGRASGVKLCPKEMDMWTNGRPDLARAFLGSDAERNRRDSARSGLRLLHQEQVRLKKIVQRRRKRQAREKEREEVRVMKIGTLNVGSMTGRGHEIVEFMKRRSSQNTLCTRDQVEWKQSKRIGPRVQTILRRSGHKEKWCWYYPGQ